MKLIAIFLMTLSLTSFASSEQKYDVKTFCQDLNIILQRVQIHTFNIANHQTTRTVEGGYFKRKLILNCREGSCQTTTDESSPILRYLPNHPDANENGYVAYPPFSVEEEKTKLIKAQNAYNLVVKNMPVDSINLLVGDRFKQCFEDYHYFKEQFDFQTYLRRN